MEKRALLHQCVAESILVQIVRQKIEISGKHLIGVPAAVGKDWLVISTMDDAISLDGFNALRLSDVTNVNRRFRRRSFYVRGLQRKRVALPGLPELDLESESGLLHSVQRSFSLLVINREIANTGASEVGRVIRASSRSFTLRLLDPSARWVPKTESYRTRDVTRVGFGGQYEETLAAVVGLEDPKWR